MSAPTLTPEAITALISDRNELSLRVVPGAKLEKAAIENGALKIWLRTAPEDGKANKAILAKLLGISVSQLEITHGQTAREKRVRISY
jgi:uncharacterized protein YggU (UPF0235/DUF167 family)